LRNYRRKLDIIADILQVAKEDARKTQIMYQANNEESSIIELEYVYPYFQMLDFTSGCYPIDQGHHLIKLKTLIFP
jgi:hypothetical protein